VIGEKCVVGRIDIGDNVAFVGTIGIAEATRRGRARGSGMGSFFAAILAGALFFAGFADFSRSFAAVLAGFAAADFAGLALSSSFAAAESAGLALSSGLANAGAAKANAVAIAHPKTRR
jgi:hypothetical protein